MPETLLVNQLLLGAIAMTGFSIGLFFLRFWKKIHDRFFLFFALSFIVDGIGDAVTGLVPHSSNGDETEFYAIRLVGFLILLWAIIDKNRMRGRALREKTAASEPAEKS